MTNDQISWNLRPWSLSIGHLLVIGAWSFLTTFYEARACLTASTNCFAAAVMDAQSLLASASFGDQRRPRADARGAGLDRGASRLLINPAGRGQFELRKRREDVLEILRAQRRGGEDFDHAPPRVQARRFPSG